LVFFVVKTKFDDLSAHIWYHDSFILSYIIKEQAKLSLELTKLLLKVVYYSLLLLDKQIGFVKVSLNLKKTT
jgi:hypothetical protein